MNRNLPLSVIVPAYNPGEGLLQTLDALHDQSLVAEVIVVDDGSSTDFPDFALRFPQVRRLRLARNQGRAMARNAGAQVACGEHLVFLDCDRLPARGHFLASHLALLQTGAAGSSGPVNAVGNDFWARYQRTAPRLTGTAVPLHHFSSANFAIPKRLFDEVGGFDAGYRYYGFEDRDLYARLLAKGYRFQFNAAAEAWHTDVLKLRRVWQKMRECGVGGARRFRQQHAREYRQSRYWWFDAREHRALRALSRVLSPALEASLDAAQTLLDQKWIPYRLRRALAQAYSAAAFMDGTAQD